MVASPRAVASLRWRQFIDVLESGWVFHPQTLALYALIGIPFSANSEFPRLHDPSIVAALGVSSLSVTLTVLFISIIGLTARFATRTPAWLVLVSLSGIGATRALVATLIIDSLGINDASYLDTRVILSAVAVPVLIVTAAFVVSLISKGRRERAATKRAIAALRVERDEILSEISRGDELLITESEKTLWPRVSQIIDRVKSGSTTSRAAIADALDDLITEVIRPLSHSLAASARAHHASTESISIPSATPVFPTADSFVGPLVTAAGVYLTTVVIYFDLVPLVDGMASAFIGAAITWLVLRSFQALLSGLKLGITFIISVVFLALLGSALLVAWVDVTFFPVARIGPEIVIALSAASLVPGLSFVVQRLMVHLGAVRLAELAAVRRDMAIQASEVRRRAWLRQRHIAHALHSAIQSRVNAEAQLVRKRSGPLSDSESTRITATLNDVVEVLRNTGGDAIDALDELRRAIEFWHGMCEVDFTVGDGVDDALASNPDVGETVLVTSLEIINNAIRHGRATQLCLSIERASEDMLTVTGKNNGEPLGDYQPGLGMSMFDELAVHWSMASTDDLTTITAFIAARPATETDAAPAE
ncbi:MAG: hypothetical protein RLZ72_1007 [Actinomycetota bacterium]